MIPPGYFPDDQDATLQKTASKPLGSGPFHFKEWVNNDHLTVEANMDYWDGPPPFKGLVAAHPRHGLLAAPDLAAYYLRKCS